MKIRKKIILNLNLPHRIKKENDDTKKKNDQHSDSKSSKNDTESDDESTDQSNEDSSSNEQQSLLTRSQNAKQIDIHNITDRATLEAVINSNNYSEIDKIAHIIVQLQMVLFHKVM